MRKAFISSAILLLIITVFIGLVLFGVFFGRVVPTVFNSECWASQIKSARLLIPTAQLSGNMLEKAGLALKECLLMAVIGNNQLDENGGNLCVRVCDSLFGAPAPDGTKAPDPQDCAATCSRCGDRGVILLVPNIPGLKKTAGGFFVEKQAFDTFKRRFADETTCISTGKTFAVGGEGYDQWLEALKITGEKGNVACLTSKKNNDKQVTVELDGYVKSVLKTVDPEVLATEACGFS